jgi:excisionase family DNA binding protein
MTVTDASEWPSVRDVGYETRLSVPYVMQLIHTGKLYAIKTRAGYLVDPASVAAWLAAREAKRAEKEQATQA